MIPVCVHVQFYFPLPWVKADMHMSLSARSVAITKEFILWRASGWNHHHQEKDKITGGLIFCLIKTIRALRRDLQEQKPSNPHGQCLASPTHNTRPVHAPWKAPTAQLPLSGGGEGALTDTQGVCAEQTRCCSISLHPSKAPLGKKRETSTVFLHLWREVIRSGLLMIAPVLPLSRVKEFPCLLRKMALSNEGKHRSSPKRNKVLPQKIPRGIVSQRKQVILSVAREQQQNFRVSRKGAGNFRHPRAKSWLITVSACFSQSHY